MALNIKLEAIKDCKVLRISSECLVCCDEIVCPETFISLTGTITIPGYTTNLTISPTDDSGIFYQDFDITDLNPSVTEFPSEIYKIDYTITHTGGDMDLTAYYPVLGTIDRCFATILGKTKDWVGVADKQECLEYINNAFIQKQSLELQVIENEDDLVCANEILDYLQAVCDNQDCECYG